jgi:hypothetical protein
MERLMVRVQGSGGRNRASLRDSVCSVSSVVNRATWGSGINYGGRQDHSARGGLMADAWRGAR